MRMYNHRMKRQPQQHGVGARASKPGGNWAPFAVRRKVEAQKFKDQIDEETESGRGRFLKTDTVNTHATSNVRLRDSAKTEDARPRKQK